MDKRCPLKLKSSPCQNCPLGQNTFKTFLKPQQRCTCKIPEINDLEDMRCSNCRKHVVTCNWAIKSPDYNFCFWKYAESEEGFRMRDGKYMENMIGITEQRIGQILKDVIEYLKKRVDIYKLFKKTKEGVLDVKEEEE